MAEDFATRGRRDALAAGAEPMRARDLKRLADLRYGLADGDPDVRGWSVYSSAGRVVGTVADLLVDPDAGEVVMLDVDVEGTDQHTLAPIRATWIDPAARRVVLDAPATLPALPRSGPLTDADVQRFDAAYAGAYGARAADDDTRWRVARGTDDGLQFGPRRVPHPPVAPVSSSTSAAPTSAAPVETERRVNRVDDASALEDEAGIDPRELDARVRIDEGGTVDDDAPVAGVRYEGEEHTPHDYGRPDEAYGPGYGSGRIGFGRIVTREPYAPSPPDEREAAAEGARSVRYRQYDDGYAGPDA